jgi:hypothetical protein
MAIFNTEKEADKIYHGKGILRGGEYLTSHSLMKFIDCPADFYARKMQLIKEHDSDAFRAGRAAHCRILEGADVYKSRYVFGGPVNPKTNKYFGNQTEKYKEWRDEQEAQGLECLTDSEDTLCEFMASGVKFHDDASAILASGDAECVVRGMYCGMKCQAKVDWLTASALVDLKTTADLRWFTSDFFKYRYHNQLSFYQKLVEQFAGIRLPVKVIAVEKAAPYRCALYDIEQAVLDKGQRENEDAIQRMRECLETGKWPTGFEGIQKISAK